MIDGKKLARKVDNVVDMTIDGLNANVASGAVANKPKPCSMPPIDLVWRMLICVQA